MKKKVSMNEIEKAKFWSKVAVGKFDDCWEWNGSISKTGYGMTCQTALPSQHAHRSSYELLVGKIPKGLVIDHLCRNRRCVNPNHMEPVTSVENVMRGKSQAALNVYKTHCIRGHELSGENLNTRYGYRLCIQCRNMHGRNGYRNGQARKGLAVKKRKP